MRYLKISILGAALAATAFIAFELGRRNRPSHPSLSGASVENPWPQAAEVLGQRVGRVDLDHVSLRNAIRKLTEQGHLNIAVYWSQLEMQPDAAGLITVDLNDATVGQALDEILAGAQLQEPKYVVQRGIIMVPGSLADDPEQIRVFNVRDLIENEARFYRGPLAAGTKLDTHTYETALKTAVKALYTAADFKGDIEEVGGLLVARGRKDWLDSIDETLAALRQNWPDAQRASTRPRD